ncbi:MAG TPA: hypothetical protein VLV76_17055 [Candidatus Acidoferrum sp.]|nr:hypothetical protein [Candidatus Acidoferrum sp.]
MAGCVRRLLSFGGAAALAAAILTPPAPAAEEGTLKAFAAWQGEGQTLQTGVKEATFIGTIAGTVYVETDKGPVDGGQLVCPAMLLVNLDDGTQSATGRCNITAKDGARIFAQLACTGVHLVGCDGDFTLTGGTDRFAGITGGGRFTVRSSLQELVRLSGSTATLRVSGIMFWRELHYQVP